MAIDKEDPLVRNNNRQWTPSSRIEAEGLEWLYADPSAAKNQPNQLEEYLLGKSIEGARGELSKEGIKQDNAGSLLNEENKDRSLDTMLSKFREDPLFIIKKAELHQKQVLQKYESLARSGHEIAKAVDAKQSTRRTEESGSLRADDRQRGRGHGDRDSRRRRDSHRRHHRDRRHSSDRSVSVSQHRRKRSRSVDSLDSEERYRKRDKHERGEKHRSGRHEEARPDRRNSSRKRDEDGNHYRNRKRRYRSYSDESSSVETTERDREESRRRDRRMGRSRSLSNSRRRSRAADLHKDNSDFNSSRTSTKTLRDSRSRRSTSPLYSKGHRSVSKGTRRRRGEDKGDAKRSISHSYSSSASSDYDRVRRRRRRSVTDSSYSSYSSPSPGDGKEEKRRGDVVKDVKPAARKLGPQVPRKKDTLKYAFAVTDEIMPPQAILDRAEQKRKEMEEQKRINRGLYASRDSDSRLEEMRTHGSEHLKERLKQMEDHDKLVNETEEEVPKSEAEYIASIKQRAYESAKLAERIRQRASKGLVDDE